MTAPPVDCKKPQSAAMLRIAGPPPCPLWQIPQVAKSNTGHLFLNCYTVPHACHGGPRPFAIQFPLNEYVTVARNNRSKLPEYCAAARPPGPHSQAFACRHSMQNPTILHPKCGTPPTVAKRIPKPAMNLAHSRPQPPIAKLHERRAPHTIAPPPRAHASAKLAQPPNQPNRQSPLDNHQVIRNKSLKAPLSSALAPH